MKRLITRRKVLGICIGLAVLIPLWNFDPNASRVRSRFPFAVIKDWSEWAWLLPGFMHGWGNSNDLYEGRYLEIEIAKQDVDLRKFADIPFIVLSLSHCKVTGSENIERMRIGNNRTISLHDCDVSENSTWPLPGVPDLHHATNDIGGP